MNEDIRKFGFTVGLMCFFMGLISLVVGNYVYFFLPERSGGAGTSDIVLFNIMTIAGIVLGKWLLKNFGSSTPRL